MNSYVATLSRRVCAKLIDSLLIAVIVWIVAINGPISGTDELIYLSLVKYLYVVFLIPFVYDLLFLIWLQQTPGKWMMQLKVVPIGRLGDMVSVSQAFLRSLTEHLLGFLGIAYFIPVLWRFDRRHLGDLISETVVVQVPPRSSPTKIYPVFSIILLLLFLMPAMQSFSRLVDQIDWQNQRIVIDYSDVFDDILQLEEDLATE